MDDNNLPKGLFGLNRKDVESYIASIKNDYDARRAGEQALEEMVHIARKTGAQSVRR